MAAPIVVLKFGSSVLADRSRLLCVVHEIYRAYRSGQRVVAVVSAIGRHTDILLEEAEHLGTPVQPEAAIAQLLSTGEQQSAALLTIAARRAGILCTLLDPASIGLVLAGDYLDAVPVGLNRKAVLAALAKTPVVVLPGFAGCHQDGGTAVMGRGGSDLTAVFLADKLQTTSRLVKDVTGIFEYDPATADKGGHREPPHRYGTITYEDALRVADVLVQPKAIEYLQHTGNKAVVTALLQHDGTLVGAPTSCIEDARPLVPMKVLLMGFDEVGQGVYQHLSALPEFFEVVGVAASDVGDERQQRVPKVLLGHSIVSLQQRDYDVLVDTGYAPDSAFAAIRHAFEKGLPAVTASTALMLEHGATLRQLAHEHAARFLSSATSTGCEGCWPAAEAVFADLMELHTARNNLGGANSLRPGTLPRKPQRRPPVGN